MRFLLASLLVACSAEHTGDSDDVTSACVDATGTPLGMDEQSPLGFSGADLAAKVGEYPYTAGTWAYTGATVDVLVHAEGFDGATYFEAPEGCDSWLEIEGMVQLEAYSDDPGTDMWPTGPVKATDLDGATVVATIAAEEAYVGGTYMEDDIAEYEDVVFTLENAWTFGAETTTAGTMAISATRIADGEAYTATLLTWPSP